MQEKCRASHPKSRVPPLSTSMLPFTVKPDVPEPPTSLLAKAATRAAPAATVTSPVTITCPALTAHAPVTDTEV